MNEQFLDKVKFRKFVALFDSDKEGEASSAFSRAMELCFSSNLRFCDAIEQAFCFADEGVNNQLKEVEASNAKLTQQLADARKSLKAREAEVREEIDRLTKLNEQWESSVAESDQAYEALKARREMDIFHFQMLIGLMIGAPCLIAFFIYGPHFPGSWWGIGLYLLAAGICLVWPCFAIDRIFNKSEEIEDLTYAGE